MKLLHLTNHYPPFSAGSPERQCRMLVNELAARGHSNRVLTSNRILKELPDREPAACRQLAVANGTAPSFRRLIVNERENLRVLRSQLAEFQPDLVLVWSMGGLSNSLLWELQGRGAPTAFAVLDSWPRHRLREDPWLQWWTSPLPFAQRTVRRTLRLTAADRPILRRLPVRRPTDLSLERAFFVSRALRENIRSAGYRVEGSTIIPSALGRDEIPVPSQQRRDAMRRLLWIGPLENERDPITAIQAIQELRHEGQMGFSLDLFGRGEPVFENRLQDYIRDAQLSGSVNLRRAAALDEIAPILPGYDALVFTARRPGPFPLEILRAMAARVPVVSTTEGSCSELVRGGTNALTFRTGDPVDCAARILQLATDRTLAERLAESAYRQVLDEYSAVVIAGRLDLFLQEMVESERPTAVLQ